ncbi:hypothetical protein [Foetidibacter luteolus]|uniref:hypothetical protein n=1 Tax=Foetidibacter luteolus TaxID=2608880 RepID=UPI00129AA455|nr:hypothetical protein [Foetidibacter luteolus]
MKFLIAIILTALLGYAAPLFLPWWSFAATSFIVAVIVHQKAASAFLAGFAGLFLLWGMHALLLDSANNHLLATKIAQVLGIGSSAFMLVLVTALVGGLVSGFAALAGSFTRKPS